MQPSEGPIYDKKSETGKDLTHSGVKGMKWGVRKAENNKPNEGYSTANRRRDAVFHPSGGVKRINKRMNKGATLHKARIKEGQRTAVKVAAIVAVYNSPRMIISTINALDKYGGEFASSVAQKAETNRGRANAAETMGLPRVPTEGPSYAKKSKGGAYKISSV